MFAGPRSIYGRPPRPAFAVTGSAAIHVLQSFVLDLWIGVRGEGPDFADLFVHISFL
jgi:hypothetical protein